MGLRQILARQFVRRSQVDSVMFPDGITRRLTEFDDLYDTRKPSGADNDIVTAIARAIHGAIDRGASPPEQ